MTTYPNNPQSVYNGMISGQRNMFLSSSLAVAMIGFSDKFDNKFITWLTKLVGSFIFILSIIIGLSTANDYTFYLDNINTDDLPSYIPLENWYRWSYISYIYSLFMTVIGGLYIIRKIIH
jgi:hypothetical protein